MLIFTTVSQASKLKQVTPFIDVGCVKALHVLLCKLHSFFSWIHHGWGFYKLANELYVLLLYVMGDIESTMAC